MVEFLKSINTQIKGQKIKIEKGADESDGTEYLALISLVENQISKCGTIHNPIHLKFLNKLLATIVASESGLITMIEAINLCKSLADETARAKITLKIAETLIDKWNGEMILSKLGRGSKLTIGVRGLLELAPFLEINYPDDCSKCHFCKRFCLRGDRCASCPIKIHEHCGKDYRKTTNKCPGCNNVWDPDTGTTSNTNTTQQCRSSDSHEERDEIPVRTQRGRK